MKQAKYRTVAILPNKAYVMLGWLGLKPVTPTYALLGKIATVLYEGGLMRIAARHVQKFGKRYLVMKDKQNGTTCRFVWG